MPRNFITRYRTLIQHIKNWPRYFLYKWMGYPELLQFTTRKHNLSLCIPKETLPVFKEFFMEDAYRMQFLKNHLTANAIVMDIGANIGLFPIRLLMEQPQLTIYSFEPLPNNFAILQQNISGNAFTRDRVKVFNLAVLGYPQKTINIYYNRNCRYTDSASLLPGFAQNEDPLPVTATSLQEIMRVNHLRNIDLLKLDCEGSEFSILYNTPEELIRQIPLIVAEIHTQDEEQNNLPAIKKFFYRLGYTVQCHRVTDKIHMLWARKNETPLTTPVQIY